MAYNPNAPADDEFLADFPAEQREQQRAILEDQIVDAEKLQGLSPGNASGNVPISNGTRNVNLNADLLDGKEAVEFSLSGHTHSVATTNDNGFMSNTDKTKLDGISSGAEVNQNAFANVKVGSTTIQADAKQDTLELTAGTNITLTPDATNDKVTIAAPNVLPLAGGTMTGSLDTPRINLKYDFAKGTTPSATKYAAVYISDINGNNYGTNGLGLLENRVDANNVVSTYIRALRNQTASTTNCEISVNVDNNGNVYTSAPTPATADNSTKIATTAFVKAQGYTTATGHNHDSTYLKLSGGTLTGSLVFGGADWAEIRRDRNNSGITIYSYNADATGSDGAFLAMWGGTRGDFNLSAAGTNNILSGNSSGVLTWCGNNVATTNNTVNLTGNQTIAGTKTFSASPYVSVATPGVALKMTGFAIGTNPSSQQSAYTRFYDKNGVNCGGVVYHAETDNDRHTGLYARNKANDAWAAVLIHANDTSKYFIPYATKNCTLGSSARLWTTVYAQTATINTSDEREKDLIDPIPNEVLDAWGNINLVRYKLKDSIAEKGSDKARYHTGVIAQNVQSEFAKIGLDPTKYGFYCHDEWEHKDAQYDEDGIEVSPEQLEGDMYSIRYEEALCIEAAYQRRRADRLEARIARLEALLNV